MPKIADLERTHPEYDPVGFRDLDLFYRGGSALIGSLGQDAANFMLWPSANRNFIRRNNEPDAEYADRKNRAYALGYMGTIVDFFASLALRDPPRVEMGGGEAAFYEDFAKDVDRAGCDLGEFARQRLVDALVYRRSYALADVPPAAPVAPSSLAEQDEYGERRAYLTPVAIHELRDWERDDRGRFSFFVIRTQNRERNAVASKRDTVKVTWRVYEAGAVTVYFATHKHGEALKETEDATQDGLPVPRPLCPLVELMVPAGLHVGAKLLSAERELFNKQNALSWAEYRTAFAFLLARVKDPNDTARRYTDGSMALCMPDEDIAWREATGGALTELRAGLDRTKEEIFRVASQLALAAPLGAVQQAASGEAKRRDSQPSVIVCRALGRMLREWLARAYDVVASLRGETAEAEVTGLEKYDESIDDLLRVLPELRSPTAETEARMRLVETTLPHLTPEQHAEIREEIEAKAEEAEAQKKAMDEAAADALANGGNGAPEAEEAVPPKALPAKRRFGAPAR
ncbi:MAG TPA: hypothetical protein VJP77_05665 [Planctomycetota bacterium]|nr:hypothetical protein [Planctomycetota bacterium]